MADSIPGTISTTASLTGNTAYVSQIDTPGDHDWYRLTLTAGTTYSFDVLGSGSGSTSLTLADPYLFLRDSTGQLLLTNDDGGVGHSSRLFYTPTISGTYYLDACAYSVSATGSYAVVMNTSPIVGAISLGTISGAMNTTGDMDVYAVTLTAGHHYRWALNGVSLSDPYLELLDASGINVASDDDSGAGLNALLDYTPTASGTYYVLARAAANNQVGSYNLVMSELPTISINDVTVTEGDIGSNHATFTISLSEAVSSAVSVNYITSASLATASVDYQVVSGVATIAAGATSTTVNVPIYGDTQFEAAENFYLNLSNPVNAYLGDASGEALILDNDASPTIHLPADPLVNRQWHLFTNYGIDVLPVWADYSGLGVKVGIFDQGINAVHPDLSANFVSGLSVDALGLSGDGLPTLTTDNHGTAVSGTVAAARNGLGVVGVAYQASLVSIYSSLTNNFESEIQQAYTYAQRLDILNDSWGYSNYFKSSTNYAFYDNFLDPNFMAAAQALADLARLGRGGLGTIVVQSAGNSYSYGDDTNLHNFQNSPYIITVAATNYAGAVATFSSPGTSILVTAPGQQIYTTDRLDADGYQVGDYAYVDGTSFSAPIVSGVVALMLQANPDLGYRDVQEILAYTSQKIDANSATWSYNGATNWNGGGLHYDVGNNRFGYGLVDAQAAVRLAETWHLQQTVSNLASATVTRAAQLAIPDANTTGITDSLSFTTDLQIERVDVHVQITHPYIGDLKIQLIAPSGVSSWLLWRPASGALSAFGSSQDNINFTFDTVANWGESSVGTWGLHVVDAAGLSVGTLDQWSLTVYGKHQTQDDVYVYTDEFSDAVSSAAARAILQDASGSDTLNASAVTTASVINLVAGSNDSRIDGRSLTMGGATTIEKAYGGDGADLITGNTSSNTLFGMRGADTLIGGLGNDSLSGGTGDDVMDGGAGVDTAYLNGFLSSYQVTSVGAEGLLFTSTTESDRYTSIEYFHLGHEFETAISTSMITSGQAAQQVERLTDLYLAFFGRAPDVTGLEYWQKQSLEGVKSFATISEDFAWSQEAQRLFPSGLSNREFVRSIYQNCFDREPDAGGWDYWTGVLNQRANDLSTKGQFVGELILGAYAPTSGPADREMLTNKHDVALYYVNALAMNTNESFDTAINDLLDRVTGLSDTKQRAEHVIDYVIGQEVTLTGVMTNSTLLQQLWVV